VNVVVYRLIAKNTTEEKVTALKARKAELFRGVMEEGDFATPTQEPRRRAHRCGRGPSGSGSTIRGWPSSGKHASASPGATTSARVPA
jgi:hypothetical protein